MKRIQREIGLDERFLHFIFSFIVVLALCSLYWTGCIELSLFTVGIAQYYSISYDSCAFLVELRLIGTGKGRESHDFGTL